MSITTNGTPSMVGKNKGVKPLLQKHMENNGINNSIVKLQCLIYKEGLCAKVASLKNIMEVVVKTVNFYFVARIESSSISTTTLRNRESVW